ncbi:VIT domain-containing protein [Massilia sp. YIM B02763]|uniref:VIT domain-containing protein n=1 Tax=Massilia sp. YIM B02763 TaxID=3050130 RepID=UPI0025B6BAC6|nr:VIT domain-containing protein [Massilia sp. YIM B02763]MDN4051679.1 VIT domain-containing protein [Massilia sp. YIM B02763]
MPYRFSARGPALALACLLALPGLAPVLAQDGARPLPRALPPPLLAVQGAETPVRLQAASIAVDIGAGMADTTIELAFRNPNARVLEGELQFPLAPGQKIVGFALDIGGEMRPAVPVDKARGRQVFEEIARRGVDPGLLEATQGDNFKLRIYPIPAGGERRVRLRIAQPLARGGGGWHYRLPLPPSLSDAAGAAAWHASVRVHGADSAPHVVGATEASALRREGDGFAAELPRTALANGQLAIQGRADDNVRAFTGMHGDTGYFVAEIPVATAPRPRRLPSSLVLLWDSSGSGAARRHDLEFALLERYLRAAGDLDVRLVRLRDRAEAPHDFRVRGGDWSVLRRELEATVYDGASALGGWRPDGRAGDYLLFSDGLDNYGTHAFPALAPHQRLFAVNAAAGAGTARLDALARRTGGHLVDLGSGDIEAAAAGLLQDAVRIAALAGDGLDALQAEAPDVRGGVLRVAGRRLRPDGMLRVTLDDGRMLAVPVTPASPVQPLAPLLWAGWRIDALQDRREENRGEIARLGRRFGIATGDTSLIVLELAADYARYDIAPPPALRAEVERLKAGGAARAAQGRAMQLERVVRDFEAKQAWWAYRFPKDAPPPDAVAPSGKSIPVTVQGSAVRAPGAVMPPLPPPPPPSFASSFLAAPAPEAVQRRVTGAPPAPAPATASPTTGIALRPWTPDARHVDRMARADARQAYAIYLDEKPDHANSTAFYLDVADTLLDKGDRVLALRVLSNLAEMDLENRHVLRVLGYRLLQAGAPELAVPVFEEVLRLAEEEPQSWRDLGLAYAAAGRPQQAVDTLYQVAVRDWNARFAEVELIALADMNAIAAANRGKVDTRRIDPRLLRNLPLDLRVVLSWDADNSDMDLWVTDPNGERCMYSHPRTWLGGRLSQDATGGYGPEEFSLREAKPGKYKVEANFFGSRRQVVAGVTTLQARLTTGFGTPRAKEQLVTLRLRGRGDTVFVGEFDVPAAR